jgi:hypothetical protein
MSALFEKIRQVLYQSFDREELVGVHYEPDAFEVGFIRSIDGENFKLERIDRYGSNWGFLVGTIDKIMRVQTNTQYMQAVQLLLEKQKAGPTPSRGAPDSLEMEKLLAFVVSKNIVAGLHNEDGVVIYGYVRSYSDDHVEIEEISFLGNEDGIRIIPVEDVIRLTYGGPDEESRMFLNRVRLGL